MKTNEEQLS